MEKKKLTEAEILSIAMGSVGDATKFFNDTLESEIEENLKYYMGDLPAPGRQGTSKYVSQDTWDCVESLKAQLLETFSGNPDNLISFPPLNDKELKSSLVATEYCSYQVWRLNPGFDICRAVIHDGLTSRIGVVKVYWDEKYEDIEEAIPGCLSLTCRPSARRKTLSSWRRKRPPSTAASTPAS